MIACSTCGSHARPSDACPFCGAVRIARNTAVVALLGLSACVGTTSKDSETPTDTGSMPQDLYGVPTTTEPQPEYGTAITDTATGTGDTGSTN